MEIVTPARPVKLCDAVRNVRRDDHSYVGSWGATSWTRKAQLAEQALATAWKIDQETHAANADALAHNRTLRDHLKSVMASAGIKDQYSVRDAKSRAMYPKSKTVPAGYLSDIAHFIVISDGYETAEKVHLELTGRFAGWRVKADEEKAAKEAEREADKRRRMADMELATILVRYGFAPDADDWTILKDLRDKDKYLDLAVAMENVRGDWNDGCDQVADALSRFPIVDGPDPIIAADVASAVVRFSECQDGRVFRDTTYSYERLYSMVGDQQLVSDAKFMRGRSR